MAWPLIATLASTAARWTMTAGIVSGFIAGILRVITLLGIGISVYEGIDTLWPHLQQLLAQTQGAGVSGPSATYTALGQVFGLLKIQEALSVIVGAIGTRLTFRAGLVLTKTATGGG